MKSLAVFILAAVASLTVLAETTNLVTDSAAQLKICPPRMAGCANKILINKTEYIISYDEANNADGGIEKLMNGMIDACRFQKLALSPAFAAEGFIAKEKGHFPNPMAEFTVFKISYVANVNFPK